MNKNQLFGLECLTGALLERLTHHVHTIEIKGDCYRPYQRRWRRQSADPTTSSRGLAP